MEWQIKKSHNHNIFNQNPTQHIMAKQQPSLTEWRIIGVSGATADGREISATELQEMAETYDPEIYTAKINLEHFRFLFSDWQGAYGDVRELKAEPWAKDPSKTALLAKFSVLPALQEVWDRGSKVFTSMEIQNNFAKSGKAYLVGLAITDSPASLGTTQNYSLVKTKLADDIKLSEYKELEMQPEQQHENHIDDKPLTVNVFQNLMNKFFAKSDDKQPEKQPENPSEPQPEKQENYAQQIAALQQENKDQAALFERTLQQQAEMQAEIQALQQFKQRIEVEPYTGNRKEHGGGNPIAEAGW